MNEIQGAHPGVEESIRETPMAPVWLIVIVTMLVSTSIMYGWHIVAMGAAAKEDQKEVDVVRERIVKLTEYKSVLESGGQQAAEDLLKKDNAQTK